MSSSSAPSATASATPRTGGEILVDALAGHGVKTTYCVPGESYLAVLDALYDKHGIRNIVCRHEGAAANMAESHGKLTGEPGICFVTRGPGATHASVGVHTAFQDSTPMILFVGQVARDCVEREAFQEIDYRRMFGQLTKWVAEIESADRIPEYVARAFSTAVSGRPGPVVLALPEDMLKDVAQVLDAPRYKESHGAPRPAEMSELAERLERAEKPLLILGGSTWTEQAREDLRTFAEANYLPVAAAFRFQSTIDNTSSNYIGDVGLGINPKLVSLIREADLVVAIGPRLGESTTGGYTMFNIPKPHQSLVHVHTSAEELGRVYQADQAINSGMPAFVEALKTIKLAEKQSRKVWLEEARANYLRHTTPGPIRGNGVDMAHVVHHLSETLPDDAIIASGAGNYTVWIHRYYRHRGFRTQLAPTSGAMGYGFPAGIAAKIEHPDKVVVAFGGDGCFMMYPQELATAVQHDARLIVIVVNNGMYGTIRFHQETNYPGRVSGTNLVNPDFAAFARSFGVHGEVVTKTEDFPAAFDRALKVQGPSLIELRTDPNVITPSTTLTELRAKQEAAKRVVAS
jgi:acetolactate synthase-1/2/3 large subunit